MSCDKNNHDFVIGPVLTSNTGTYTFIYCQKCGQTHLIPAITEKVVKETPHVGCCPDCYVYHPPGKCEPKKEEFV